MNRPIIRRRPLLAEPLGGIHPVVARVFAARDVRSLEEIDASLANLLPPALADMEAAVDRLARAIRDRERILVVGDFDADGATSTALAVRVLRAFGHEEVDYLVPNRFEDGYGLTPELLGNVRASPPDVILTVDNGVSSHEGVRMAAVEGIDVVVTDHHLPGDDLPPAVAVVNPNRAECGFASKNLAGVGVVFYVLAALRSRLEADGHFPSADMEVPSMATFLDLVALGTVADVVRLDRNNRILVEQGVRRLRAGRGTPGIAALLRAGNRDPRRATAGDLAYAVAPRLNAAGRLADMVQGIEALLADDSERAQALAGRLDELNRERRDIEAEMKAQADAEVDRLRAELDAAEELPAGLVLHDPRWHQGVSGILAGRMRQAVHRPTVIFADAGDGLVRGSGRSVPGLHIRDALAAIDARHPDLIQRFGGHAMAAGLTVALESIDDFREVFCAEVERVLGGSAPLQEILTDGRLEPAEMTLETAEALRSAAPWGSGFPAPTFDGDFRIRDYRTVGVHHLKLSVEPVEGGRPIEAIAFHADPGLHKGPGERARMVYRMEVNEYRGRRALQLVVEHMERVDDG